MNRDVVTLLVSILLLITSTTGIAEIYKWTDAQGKIHFTDSPPEGEQAEQVELRINTYTAVEITPLVERLGKEDRVVIYGATWCRICDKAKKYFRENNIPYVSYDVEKSQVGRMDFKLLKGRSVPIIIVGRKRMNGFNVAKFEKLYKEQMGKDDTKDEQRGGV
jgi:glutaredoxin